MANTYTGFIGCSVAEQTQAIETFINNWYDENDLSIHHFSAERNSREFFFTNVSHWMMKLIAVHQDYWCNNPNFHSIMEILPKVHALSYIPAAKEDDVNRVILDLFIMIDIYRDML